ncbi:hypothetical protein QBC38DRAFT_440950 [Podospora fimiseda]|uniref:Uncharacterized protein n=1 Tax=Podospora fimiseda TaxID=252190 RepID=A0AAN7BVX3_9PEZI|nr:hypothetical protein QBC38DRAFT_440950 [Podospora fimiseda]
MADKIEKICHLLEAIPAPDGEAFGEFSAAYNFKNLWKPSPGGKVRKTIEFRRAEGTVDGEVAVAWVDVFGRIVNAGVRYDETKFQKLIERLLRSHSQFGVKEFLMGIGCQEKSVDVLLEKRARQDADVDAGRS